MKFLTNTVSCFALLAAASQKRSRLSKIPVVAVSCVMVFAAASTPARAQGIANSFTELKLLAKPGDTISVTGPAGGKVTGRLVELSSSELTLTVRGLPKEFREADVTTVHQYRGDSLRNGALTGLGVGAGFAAIAAAASCGPAAADGECAGYAVLSIGLWAGIGAAAGAGVDALIPTRYLIYEHPGGQGAHLRISPILTPQRQGVRASMTF